MLNAIIARPKATALASHVDSTWALVEPSELEEATTRIKALNENGELESFFAEHEAKRKVIGQVTFVYCSRT